MALHGVARVTDNAAAGVESDDNLSKAGIQRKRAALGIVTVKELQNFEPHLRAERAVRRDIETFTSKMSNLLKTPSSPAEVSDAVEIRNFVRQQKSPVDYIIRHMTDPRVLRAVLHAPLPDLVGLTQAEFNHVRSKALSAAHPEQVVAIDALSKALGELNEGMAATRRLVCERTETRLDADGEFRSIYEPAPQPRLSVVPGQATAAAVVPQRAAS